MRFIPFYSNVATRECFYRLPGLTAVFTQEMVDDCVILIDWSDML